MSDNRTVAHFAESSSVALFSVRTNLTFLDSMQMQTQYPSPLSLLALSLSIVFSIAGQLLLKWVAVDVIGTPFGWPYLLHIGAALLIYSLGVVNWVLALRHLRLSVAYPVTSVSYAGILLGSYYWFGEEIAAVRVFGVGLIFVGVMLVVLGLPASTPEGVRK